jgi:hypothetical protein
MLRKHFLGNPGNELFQLAKRLFDSSMCHRINGFHFPAAIQGFGLPLSHASDAAIVRIKADRDLFIGLIVACFLLLKMRRSLIVMLLVGTGMPLIDHGLFSVIPLL